MLIPLHGLSTWQALALLGVGASVLACTVLIAPRLRPWLLPALVVLGLWIVAATLGVLKNRTAAGATILSPHFVVMRNAESMALAAIPLMLAALQYARISRAVAPVMAVGGIGLIGILLWSWLGASDSEGPIRITVTRLPGSFLLQRDGNIHVARWLWCLGAVLLALPAARALWRRRRGTAAAASSDLGFTLLGLALTSMAMGIFFWHELDWSDRQYAYLTMFLIGLVAPLLVLGAGRIATVRWAQHGLSLFSALIVFWLVTGVAGGGFEVRSQAFSEGWPSLLLLFALLLIVPVLAIHLAIHALIASARKRRPAAAQDRGI